MEDPGGLYFMELQRVKHIKIKLIAFGLFLYSSYFPSSLRDIFPPAAYVDVIHVSILMEEDLIAWRSQF